MATISDVSPEYDNIKTLTDERKRHGAGLPILSHDGHLTLIDDPGDIPPLPDNVVTVDRARFERLLTLATRVWMFRTFGGDWIETVREAADALQPSDIRNPLPD